MKKNLTVGFRVSIYDCGNPQELWKILKPKNCKDEAWIPQTMGDQIWMWFEFHTERDKDVYIDNLIPIKVVEEYTKVENGKMIDVKKTITFNPIDHLMLNEDYWTQERINHWTQK